MNDKKWVLKGLMWSKRIVIVLVITVIAALASGCAAALVGGAAGAGAVMYSKGELKSTENASMNEVWAAARETVNSMDLEVVTEDMGGTKANLLAKEPNGDNVRIELEQKPNDLTEMKIRVGAFGDEDRARVIQQEIRQRLS